MAPGSGRQDACAPEEDPAVDRKLLEELVAPGAGATPWWAPVALSWSFLTAFPGARVDATPGALAGAIALFPAVGVALGGLIGALGLVLDGVLPSGPTAVLLLAAAGLMTGGLHVDGLMDTADGIFGGRTIARRLEIMRDSRVGSFGVIAGVLGLLGQFACLAELTGVGRLVALVVACGLSRWAIVIGLGVFPPARPTGLGATFRAAGGRRPLAAATLLAGCIAAVGGVFGLVGFAVAGGTVLLGGRFLTARLGGLTGDTYGALAVVAETLVLYAAVALQPA